MIAKTMPVYLMYPLELFAFLFLRIYTMIPTIIAPMIAKTTPVYDVPSELERNRNGWKFSLAFNYEKTGLIDIWSQCFF